MGSSWKSLFSHPAKVGDADSASENRGSTVELEVRVLHRGGEPLLIIPRGQHVSPSNALCLYPAQTSLARLARALCTCALSLGFVPGSRRESVRFNPTNPFIGFLGSLVGRKDFPALAILAGNPHARGRRFLMLLVDARGEPTVVVKAAVDAEGAGLINKEAALLSRLNQKSAADSNSDKVFSGASVPRFRARFESGHITAMATDFYAGDSPAVHSRDRLSAVLLSWLDTNRSLSIAEFSGWQRLARASAQERSFSRLAARLEGTRLRPAVFHGDFAPWNVKVSPVDGSWTVLDWERGEWPGLPGFDWFHFVLQPAMLARKEEGAALLRTSEQMLADPLFRSYAQSAGLAGVERDWLLAYLFHCRDVLCPVEGSPRVEGLLEKLLAEYGSL